MFTALIDLGDFLIDLLEQDISLLIVGFEPHDIGAVRENGGCGKTRDDGGEIRDSECSIRQARELGASHAKHFELEEIVVHYCESKL